MTASQIVARDVDGQHAAGALKVISIHVEMTDAADALIDESGRLLATLVELARDHRDTVMIGRTHGVHAEPTTFGLRLAGWCSELDRNLARLRQARADMAKDFEEYSQDETSGSIRPQKALWDARQAMGPSDVLLSDVGAHKMWIARHYQCHEPNTCLIPNGFCSMGFALPGAIAAGTRSAATASLPSHIPPAMTAPKARLQMQAYSATRRAWLTRTGRWSSSGGSGAVQSVPAVNERAGAGAGHFGTKRFV